MVKQKGLWILGFLFCMTPLVSDSRSIPGHIMGYMAAGLSNVAIGYTTYVLSKKIYDRFLPAVLSKPLAHVNAWIFTIGGAWLTSRYVHDHAYIMYSRERLSPVYGEKCAHTLKEYLQSLIVAKILDRKIKEMSIDCFRDQFSDVSAQAILGMLDGMSKFVDSTLIIECKELYQWYINFDQLKTPYSSQVWVDAVDIVSDFAPLFYTIERGGIDSGAVADMIVFMKNIRARVYSHARGYYTKMNSVLVFETFVEKTFGYVLTNNSIA